MWESFVAACRAQDKLVALVTRDCMQRYPSDPAQSKGEPSRSEPA